MRRTYICGMPVRIHYLDRQDQTLIHIDRAHTIFQRQLIADWLVASGNVVIPGRWTYVAVQGPLVDSARV